MISLTNRQARQFMLLKHGLLGEHKYKGKQGALDYIRKTGCIQFDPVDVCGRSADITLNSRVSGYTKQMLDDLLYKDRRLIDHFDKNLSIFVIEDLPALLHKTMGGGYAEAYDMRGGDAVKQIMPLIRKLISERGHISAAEVDCDETIEWHWSIMTSLPRAALESMYFRGELIIHHKTGTNKSYALMKDHVPADVLNAAPPFNTEDERLAWHLRRRIGAVGMLWNRPSDAFLGLQLKTAERTAAFARLTEGGSIFAITVEGIKDPLYIREEDRDTLETVLAWHDVAMPGKEPVSGGVLPVLTKPDMVTPDLDMSARAELIAPLDSFMWDRKLIKALFGFEYSWEIYTPAVKRKYGAYVLPILCGDRFIGRVEAVCDRKSKTLIIKNIWYEEGFKRPKKIPAAIGKCFKKFAKFNDCDFITYE